MSITYYVGDSKRTTTATLGSQAAGAAADSRDRGRPPTPSAGEGSPASGTLAVRDHRRDALDRHSQSGAAPGMSKLRSGWAGGKFMGRVGLPPTRLDVLEHVGHVVRVLLVGELPVAGIDQARVARLAVRRPVGLGARA